MALVTPGRKLTSLVGVLHRRAVSVVCICSRDLSTKAGRRRRRSSLKTNNPFLKGRESGNAKTQDFSALPDEGARKSLAAALRGQNGRNRGH